MNTGVNQNIVSPGPVCIAQTSLSTYLALSPTCAFLIASFSLLLSLSQTIFHVYTVYPGPPLVYLNPVPTKFQISRSHVPRPDHWRWKCELEIRGLIFESKGRDFVLFPFLKAFICIFSAFLNMWKLFYQLNQPFVILFWLRIFFRTWEPWLCSISDLAKLILFLCFYFLSFKVDMDLFRINSF